jgi:arylsulfatase
MNLPQPSRRSFLGAGIGALGALHAAPARRPNFLFLFPDQHRFDWLSGNPRIPVRTPNLDALARRGVRFAKAAVASPVCAPSRACLASGREYDECGVVNNGADFPVERVTYYRLLRDAGYHVAGCGKLDLSKKSSDWGLDGRNHTDEWGFSEMINNAGKFDAIGGNAAERPRDPYMAYLHGLGLAKAHAADFRQRQKLGYQATFPTPLPDEAYCDNWIGRNGLDLMKRFPAGKPWHLVVNFAGPHNPEDITAGMEKTCRGRDFPQPNGSLEYTPAIHNAIRQNYTAMVENLDRWVGIYVDEVKRRGELDNTVVVFSSDHGEMLGDHNRWAKSVPFEPSLSVPLLAAGPGIKTGVRSHALVSHIDIGATFLDYAGVARAEGMTAQSLRPLLEGKTRSHREFVRSGLNAWRLVGDGRYKLVRGFGPAEKGPLLFDLNADPLENVDIAAKAPDVVARLAKLLPAPQSRTMRQ